MVLRSATWTWCQRSLLDSRGGNSRLMLVLVDHWGWVVGVWDVFISKLRRFHTWKIFNGWFPWSFPTMKWTKTYMYRKRDFHIFPLWIISSVKLWRTTLYYRASQAWPRGLSNVTDRRVWSPACLLRRPLIPSWMANHLTARAPENCGQVWDVASKPYMTGGSGYPFWQFNILAKGSVHPVRLVYHPQPLFSLWLLVVIHHSLVD